VSDWELVGPWRSLPLSLNDRGHWAPRARRVAEVRSWASWAARAARIPPLTHATVGLVWYVPDRRRRDADNAAGTSKPAADGLVDAGVVPDDAPEYMTMLMPRVVYRRGKGGVSLRVSGQPVELPQRVESR
jgi:crossover junction endodeoxyribonuclease RusA